MLVELGLQASVKSGRIGGCLRSAAARGTRWPQQDPTLNPTSCETVPQHHLADPTVPLHTAAISILPQDFLSVDPGNPAARAMLKEIEVEEQKRKAEEGGKS